MGFPSLSESSGFPTNALGVSKKSILMEFPSLSESSGFPTCCSLPSSCFVACESFHLFQRVVGFRHEIINRLKNKLLWSFHLFQRVVGFRLVRLFKRLAKWWLFPSLSESSGFPTGNYSWYSKNLAFSCFHLFQRVVGFRLWGIQSTITTMEFLFPSLSESSGFPTDAISANLPSILSIVSISFRE